jgi:hypothetical protein
VIRGLVGLASVLALAACGSTTTQAQRVQSHPSPPARSPGGGAVHVAIIVMENEEYGDVVGSPEAPYVNRLARTFAAARGMYAITHPSLPNYLALTAGSTLGIDSDCTGCTVHAAGLVDQLEAAHISWKAYLEGLPHPCFTGASSDDYAKKHDPFAYFTRVTSNRVRCRKLVPLSRLAVDERAGALPRFTWITPDLCHDMHDCSVATGDKFLARVVPSLLAALGAHGLLFLTWDEGSSSSSSCCRLASGGHVLTVVAGGGARRGAALTTPTDHYSTLQTIEDVLGLPRLRGADCVCTPSLAPLLAR